MKLHDCFTKVKLGPWRSIKVNNSFYLFLTAIFLAMFLPDLASANLEGSLEGIKYKLTNVILPVLSVIGLALAALSFFTGNPNAKQHIGYAILGCMFGFGAQAIVDFIGQVVR